MRTMLVALLITLLASPTSAQFTDTANIEEVNAVYNSVYQAHAVPVGLVGTDVTACQPGTPSQAFLAAMERALNARRAIAGVLPAVLDHGFNLVAQDAALLMSANNALDHEPPPTWRCWNQERASAARLSSLVGNGNGPLPALSQLFNECSTPSLGHREDLLHPGLLLVGFGGIFPRSTTVPIFAVTQPPQPPSSRVFETRGFVTWPAEGYFPRPWLPLCGAWSFAFPDGRYAEFRGAAAEVTKNGVSVQVRFDTAPGSRLGSVGFVPEFPTELAAGDVITVTVRNVVVGGVARTYGYTVRIFEPWFTVDGPTPQTGLYWSRNVGIVAVKANGNSMALAGLLFDANGRPLWHYSVGDLRTSSAYVGSMCKPLMLADGYVFFCLRETLVFRMTGEREGMYWPQLGGGTPDAVPVEQFTLAPGGPCPGGPCPGGPRDGFWMNLSDPGRAYYLLCRGGTLGVGVLAYTSDGQPRWYGAVGPYAGATLRARLLEFLPDLRVAQDRGSVELQFTSSTDAVLTIDGISIGISLRF